MEESIIKYPKFVISCDGEAVGCVSCKELEQNVYEIGNLCIVPKFQGKGIGKQLLDKTLEYLKNCSMENVKLACSLYANSGKEAFYEKFGFKKLPNNKYGYGMLIEL